MIWRYCSLETRKRHYRCNHTRVLLCRIYCANEATSTVHVKRSTISTKVNTIHMKAKCFQRWIPSWHWDK